MNHATFNHPSEEALVECALHECDEMLLAHIEECVQCREFVDEIRTLSNEIADIEDDPVPERLCAKILAISRSRRPQNYLLTFLQHWYKKPFLIGIVTIGAILLLYALMSLNM